MWATWYSPCQDEPTLRTLLSALERSARVLTPDGAAGVVGAEGGIIAEGLQGRGFSEGQCSCGGSSALAGAWRADGALAVQEGGSAGDTRCHGGVQEGPAVATVAACGNRTQGGPGPAPAKHWLPSSPPPLPRPARVMDDPQKGTPAGTGGLAVICRASAQNPHSELGRGYWGSEQILAALTKVTEHQVRVTSSVLPVIIPSCPLQSARVVGSSLRFGHGSVPTYFRFQQLICPGVRPGRAVAFSP